MCKAKLFILFFFFLNAGYISLQLFALCLDALSCGSDWKIRISKLLLHLHICKALSTEKQKFLSSNSADDTRSPRYCSFSWLSVFLLSPFSPDVLTASQLHLPLPSVLCFLDRINSIPSHPYGSQIWHPAGPPKFIQMLWTGFLFIWKSLSHLLSWCQHYPWTKHWASS